MEINDLIFLETNEVDLYVLREFFKEEEWNDFLELDELKIFLKSSLYFVSVWDKDLLIGIGRLRGERSIEIEITDVVVKSSYQNRGVGTEIVSKLVAYIEKANPYFVQVNPVGEKEVRLYEKFGFKIIPDYIRMELNSGKLKDKIVSIRM